MGELSSILIFHVAMWAERVAVSHHIPNNQCLRKVGELALGSYEWESCPWTPTSCYTRENQTRTFPGQHSRANTIGGRVGEPVLKL